MLKLDVQGYELEVLGGASRILERVDVIVTETSLHRFQQNIPLAHEIIQHVVDLGFTLYDVADETRWPSGTLAQVDLVFVASRSPFARRRLVGMRLTRSASAGLVVPNRLTLV